MFFCTNQRGPGETSCNDCGASALQAYAKDKVKSAKIAARRGRCTYQQGWLLDRCDEGPVLVIYPQGTWYRYVDQEDIDEIIERHLVKDEVVERLKI